MSDTTIASDTTIRYRVLVLEHLITLLLSEKLIEVMKPEIKRLMSISLDSFNDDKLDGLDKIRELLIPEITDKICNNIFAIVLNEQFVKDKIHPFIEKIFFIEKLEDLIIFSENVEKNLTIHYFFTDEEISL